MADSTPLPLDYTKDIRFTCSDEINFEASTPSKRALPPSAGPSTLALDNTELKNTEDILKMMELDSNLSPLASAFRSRASLPSETQISVRSPETEGYELPVLDFSTGPTTPQRPTTLGTRYNSSLGSSMGFPPDGGYTSIEQDMFGAMSPSYRPSRPATDPRSTVHTMEASSSAPSPAESLARPIQPHRTSNDMPIGRDYLDHANGDILCGMANGLAIMTHPNVGFELALSHLLPLLTDITNSLVMDMSVEYTGVRALDAKPPQWGAVCRAERSRVHFYLHCHDPLLPMLKVFERLILDPRLRQLDCIARVYPVTSAAHPDLDFKSVALAAINAHPLVKAHLGRPLAAASSTIPSPARISGIQAPPTSPERSTLTNTTPNPFQPIALSSAPAYGTPALAHSQLTSPAYHNPFPIAPFPNATTNLTSWPATSSSSAEPSAATSSASARASGAAPYQSTFGKTTLPSTTKPFTIGLAIESHRASDFAKELTTSLAQDLPFVEFVERNPMNCTLMLSMCYFNSLFLMALWEPLNSNDLNNYRPAEMLTWLNLHPHYEPRVPFRHSLKYGNTTPADLVPQPIGTPARATPLSSSHASAPGAAKKGHGSAYARGSSSAAPSTPAQYNHDRVVAYGMASADPSKSKVRDTFDGTPVPLRESQPRVKTTPRRRRGGGNQL